MGRAAQSTALEQIAAILINLPECHRHPDQHTDQNKLRRRFRRTPPDVVHFVSATPCRIRGTRRADERPASGKDIPMKDKLYWYGPKSVLTAARSMPCLRQFNVGLL